MGPVLVYDGDCGFCTSSARFIERRVPGPARVVAWQFADLAALGLGPRECADAVQWVPGGRGGPVRSGAPAIAALLVSSDRRFWRLVGRLLDAPPARWLAGPVYRWVARNRHRLPGGTPACQLPRRH